ncbi:hypothetical protein MASR1M101_26820 [Gemmatimonas sp.]
MARRTVSGDADAGDAADTECSGRVGEDRGADDAPQPRNLAEFGERWGGFRALRELVQRELVRRELVIRDMELRKACVCQFPLF